jgi:TRAP transporter 4TM/12TM fusion protein
MIDRLRGLLTVPAVIGIGWTAFQVYVVLTAVLPVVTQRGLHVAFALALAFALASTKGPQSPWARVLNWGMLGLAGAIGIYFVVEGPRLMARIPFVSSVTTLDFVASAALIGLVLMAVKRLMGNGLAIIAVCFIVYGLMGAAMPEIIAHRGLSWSRMLELQSSTQGILGPAVMVSLNYVFFFIFFGAMLEATGGGRLLINGAIAMTGRLRSGPAMSAVLASALMGSINGSAVANVVSTGILTIPLIKKRGYSASFAAATEAAASSGGQLMPPIMGASAFILADTVGVPYQNVVIAAIVPSLIYYLAIGVRVHLEAVRQDIQALPDDARPSLRQELRERGHLLVAPVVLVYLMFHGYTPTTAAVLATAVLLGLATLRGTTRIGPIRLLQVFASTGQMAVHVAVPCAAAGIVVGVVAFSNLGIRLSDIIINASGGHLLLLLIFSAAGAIILGMGLPSTAAYIVASVLIAPALIVMGIEPIAAHLFVLYFAILSMLTPPVALAAYAAAGLARANTNQVCWQALQLSLPAYLLPFAFVYNPGILLIGGAWQTLWGAGTVLLGSFMLAAGLAGYPFQRSSALRRVALVALAFLVIVPETVTSLVGLVGGLALLAADVRPRPGLWLPFRRRAL